MQNSLFNEVQQNIGNIQYSEQRIYDIMDINLRIQNLRFYNEGLLKTKFFYNNTQQMFFQN